MIIKIFIFPGDTGFCQSGGVGQANWKGGFKKPLLHNSSINNNINAYYQNIIIRHEKNEAANQWNSTVNYTRRDYCYDHILPK